MALHNNKLYKIESQLTLTEETFHTDSEEAKNLKSSADALRRNCTRQFSRQLVHRVVSSSTADYSVHETPSKLLDSPKFTK